MRSLINLILSEIWIQVRRDIRILSSFRLLSEDEETMIYFCQAR
jgi:hypothetical protein